MQRRSHLNPRHLATLSILVGVGLVLSACEKETVGALSVKGLFEPDTLDFGDVPVGMTKVMPTSLRNTGAAVMEITETKIPPPFTMTELKMSLIGQKLAPGTTMPLNIGFIAAQEGPYEDTVQVMSGRMTAELKVKANAVLVRVPVIVVEPNLLDFGSVELGTEATKMVTVRNEGNGPGTIDSTTLESGGTAYKIDPPAPFTLAEGESRTFSITFHPTIQGTQADIMDFNVAGQPDATKLTLNGQGALALGQMLCTPSSVDFGRVERGATQQRTVSCTAGGGPVRLISATVGPMDQYFTVEGAQGTRDLQPNEAAQIVVQYAPQGLPMPHRGTLTVAYRGASGMATVDVPLSGELIPPPPTTTAISVVLRWNTNGTDVDLHLVRPGGTPFGLDDSDCFYLKKSPDWGARNDLSDNPFLDVDDTNGMGPENINLTQTAAGDYKVYVHYFNDLFFGDSIATVEVYVGGNLAGTYNRTLACDDLWEVGTVSWNGTSGTFNPTNTSSPNSGRGACIF